MRKFNYSILVSMFFAALIFMFFGRYSVIDVIGLTTLTFVFDFLYQKFWRKKQ